MADEGKKTDNQVAPEGAVEIDEQDLDAASGGLLATSPTLEPTPVDKTILTGAGPGGGPHVKSGTVTVTNSTLSGNQAY